ncbi:MAG: hypothetical protein H0W89_03480 [Candidatus Levybacteria bacterium]|nr:hypothetical protein [Candidatus Levybacteria bacterium]
MLTVLKNIIGVVLLIGVVYVVSNYFGLVQETVGVKGASTEKAEEISEEIQSDINKEAEKAADNASNVTVGEIINFFGRFQKIPEDIANVQEYSIEQINNVRENFSSKEK